MADDHVPRMRPSFLEPLQVPGERVLLRLRELLSDPSIGIEGEVLEKHAVVLLPAERRSLLSPYLNLEISEEGLRGRFSPHPNVWTGFLAAYGFLALCGLAAAMYGLAQWWLGLAPWALLGLPIAAAVIAFVYGAAVIGQGLTAGEMHELRALVDRAIREA